MKIIIALLVEILDVSVGRSRCPPSIILDIQLTVDEKHLKAKETSIMFVHRHHTHVALFKIIIIIFKKKIFFAKLLVRSINVLLPA